MKELPDGWRMASFGQVCKTRQKPKSFKIADDSEVNFVTMEQLPIGKFSFMANKKSYSIDLTSKHYFENGDILMARISPAFEKGKQGIVSLDSRSIYGFCSTEIIPLQSFPDVCEKEYLYNYLLRPSVREELEYIMEGTTGRKRLSRAMFERFPIVLPPIIEQKQIINFLHTVQKTRDACHQELEIEQKRKDVILDILFNQKVGDELFKPSYIGLHPQRWPTVMLNTIANVKGGKRGPDGAKYSETKTPYPYIRVKDMINDTVSSKNLKYLTHEVHQAISGYTISSKDVYISVAGNVGLIGTIPDDLNGANLTAEAAKISVKDENQLVWQFLAMMLATQLCQEQIQSFTVHGPILKLALGLIGQLQFPLPPKEEQLKIIEILSLCNRKIAALRREVELYDQLYIVLREELMTGRISTLPLIELSASTE